jgi:MFS family permease
MIERSGGTMARVLLATVVDVLPVFLLGSLSVLIAGDLPLDGQWLGVAAAAFWAASTLCSWVAGHLADRVAPAWALGAGAMLSATSAVGVAASDGLGMILAMLVVGGAGNAFIVPGCTSPWHVPCPLGGRELPSASSRPALSSGVLLAGAALPMAVAIGGWRAVFVGAGVIGLLCAGAMIPWQWQRVAPAAGQPRSLGRHGLSQVRGYS